jgi:hypothetical protein
LLAARQRLLEEEPSLEREQALREISRQLRILGSPER